MRPHLFIGTAFIALCAFCFASPAVMFAEQTISCPGGQYDMLDWLTMDSDLRGSNFLNGNNNPIYTVVDTANSKYYWIKGANGYPWDINLYDSTYIYQWITEYDWNYPHTYKKFYSNTNMPFVPRCATAGFPGWSIAVPPSGAPFNSVYGFYGSTSNNSCALDTTKNLNWVVNELWGPYSEHLGGNLPDPIQTLVISYRHGCTKNQNGSYSCAEKEEFHVSQRYGWVQWKHFNGTCDGSGNCTWVNDKTSTFNQMTPGSTSPDFPCF